MMASELRTIVSELTPSAGTISRFRMMVDGAFMHYQRSQLPLKAKHSLTNNRLRQRDSEHVRFLMADSSQQHNREFEAIVVLSIDVRDLREA